MSKNPVTKEIISFIEELVGSKVINVSPISYGEWSKTYSFRSQSEGEKIIRFSDYKEDFAKDDFAAKHFASSSLPIPPITKLGEYQGQYYAVSPRFPGTPIDLVSQTHMTRLLPNVLNLLNSLRLVDISTTTGYGGWEGSGNATFTSWQDYLLSIRHDDPSDVRGHGWRKNLADSPLTIDAFDKPYAALEKLVKFCPNNRYFIHSDLLHYNMLVKDDQITAVLDWGSSKFGDFLHELAWFTFFLPWHKYMQHIDIRAKAKEFYSQMGADLSNFDERLKCYEIHIGLETIAYNASKKDWKWAKAMAKHTARLAGLY